MEVFFVKKERKKNKFSLENKEEKKGKKIYFINRERREKSYPYQNCKEINVLLPVRKKIKEVFLVS